MRTKINKLSIKKYSAVLHNAVYDAALTDNEITKDGELLIDAIVVKGIGKGYAFNPERLETHREELREIISNMDERFFKGNNGNQNGALAVILKRTQDGKDWSKGDIDIEHLICLSIGLGLGNFCQERKDWLEMPYFVFHCKRDPKIYHGSKFKR